LTYLPPRTGAIKRGLFEIQVLARSKIIQGKGNLAEKGSNKIHNWCWADKTGSTKSRKSSEDEVKTGITGKGRETSRS